MSVNDVSMDALKANNVGFVTTVPCKQLAGVIEKIEDIELTVVKVNDNVPIHVKDVANVSLGPALRRGALDKEGAEAVGGVAVVRYDFNPLAAIKNIKTKIDEISPGLPTKIIIDWKKTNRAEVERFATAAGFESHVGDQLNEDAWLKWLRSKPIAVDLEKVSREEVTAFAAAHEFAAFQNDQLNQTDWLSWLRTTPRYQRPDWIIAPHDQWPDWINTSQVTIVPFYDRSGLIYETLGTLKSALTEEILITIIVVIVMVLHLRTSILISILLPLSVLMCFIGMKTFGVDANIVALSGIAIAIGTMVDMGIILCENILRKLEEAEKKLRVESRGSRAAGEEASYSGLSRLESLEVIHRASTEVGSAVVTAVSTTIVSFLPVFTMIGAEGKLFKPLAFTKTFALGASVIVALAVIPPAAHLLFTARVKTRVLKQFLYAGLVGSGIVIGVWLAWWAGLIVAALGTYKLAEESLPSRFDTWKPRIRWGGVLFTNGAAVPVIGVLLTADCLPLGPHKGFLRNLIFVTVCIGGLLGFFQVFQKYLYEPILRWCLDHKLLFLCIPASVLLLGFSVWLGPQTLFGLIPKEYDAQSLSKSEVEKLSAIEGLKYELGGLRGQKWEGLDRQPLTTKLKWTLAKTWEGFGKEFMPPLDEGSYLYMPTTMPHASIGEATNVLSLQGRNINAIPEVELAVGKIGRVRSPLDPAPISMIETIINYYPEYLVTKEGYRTRYRFQPDEVDWFRDKEGKMLPADDGQPYRVQGKFSRDKNKQLIEDAGGVPFRQWRLPLDPQLNPGREAWKGIVKPDDIWHEIVAAGQVPGTTSAPRLQPIAARIVMLQSGMRAPMGVKVKGPDLDTIERVALEIETLLKQVPSVEASAVIADRVVGKPYLEIDFKRRQIARYGLTIQQVQDVVEVAIGGRTVTTTVEGRERFPVRVRYLRELRSEIETMKKILVPASDGSHIPLSQVADINYVRGPQVIKSEDTFLTAYVLFDMKPGKAEVNVVEECQRYLQDEIDAGRFVLPPGVSYTFAGNYENQVRSQKTLQIVLPLALFIIFLILYFQFKDSITTSLVFSGIIIAGAGGFIMLWLYAQPWFLGFDFLGTDMQNLFQIHSINLSVAIWVGFLALFGIASDDGVVITTYLDQSYRAKQIDTIEDARRATLEGGLRRVRPCLMTTATTVLGLLPMALGLGDGAEIRTPMAVTVICGLLTSTFLTLLIIPTIYYLFGLAGERLFEAKAQ